MCAAVAVMPVTVILALTERSSLIVTVPEARRRRRHRRHFAGAGERYLLAPIIRSID
jgi:hypothetical protein